MYYLPKSEKFGKLTLQATYSFYDVPRVFVAYSQKQKINLLSYWVGETEGYDEWYYVCIGDEEIARVQSSQVQLRDIFSYKEIFKVDTYFNSKTRAEVKKLNPDDIDHEALPPFGITVKKVSENKFTLLEKEINQFRYDENNHEIRLFRDRGNKTIEWEPVQKIVGSWSDLCNEITDSLKLDNASLVPESSEMGSYKVKFSAQHNDIIVANALNIFNMISKNDIDGLKSTNINLEIIEELISSLKEYNIKFEIRSSSGAVLSVIDFKKSEEISKELTEYNQVTVISNKVPQADELSRLIVLCKKISNNLPFDAESELITHRQINYYKKAASLLGLVKPYTMILNPLGWKLALAKNDKEAYAILAECFENSECGWAWLKHTNAESIFQINASTATNFLIQKSIGLSEDTAKRRAVTLRNWIKEFKAHR